MKQLTPYLRFQSFNSVALAGLCVLGMALSAHAETVVVESKLADGSDNPAWKSVGKWGKSKNKSKQTETSLTSTNVASCTRTNPVPGFKISPELKSGTTYSLEVTFPTSKTQGESPDLVVAVSADGVKDSTLPATTTAFQAANANVWTPVGKFTAETTKPTFSFTYVSGTLGTNPPARWYADTVRFVSSSAEAKPETK